MTTQDILVVDDSVSVRKALERILAPQGLRVRTADSGEDALNQLDPPPGLVIADVLMPGMSGLQLAETVQARYPGLPVLLMSGVVDEPLQQQARRVGVARVMRKPFTPGELLPVVSELLGAGTGTAAPTPESPAPAASDPDLRAWTALLAHLNTQPGLLAVTLFDLRGHPLHQGHTPLPPTLGLYARFLLTAAFTAGLHVEARQPQILQVAYENRTLLLTEYAGGYLVSLWPDASGAQALTRWLRSARVPVAAR
ncbi:response regulator [Deinococcus sp. YIM 134068]|uniref:response regulator n=1 Tax=Deinococcus lichenicola TaxID=3118910 RepID=UPI002F9533AD